MTEQEQRMGLAEMLNFTKALKITRPWYFIKNHDYAGKLASEEVFTEFATHELVQGYQFKVEVYRLTKSNLLARREHRINLYGQKEEPSVNEKGERIFMIGRNILGSKTATSRELKDFYDSVRAIAGDQGNERFAVHDVKKILGALR